MTTTQSKSLFVLSVLAAMYLLVSANLKDLSALQKVSQSPANEGTGVVKAASQHVLSLEDPEEQWSAFKNHFQKTFDSNETESAHKEQFANAIQKIQAHNAKFESGEVGFKQGVNHLTDWPQAEYQKLNGFGKQKNTRAKRSKSSSGCTTTSYSLAQLNPNQTVPSTLDWREYGMVTAIKDQGQCGDCWAFSSVGALEGQHFRMTGDLVSLSEQNLLDCTGPYGNDGCNGGWMEYAYEYVQCNGGIDTEASYPYTGNQNTCGYNAANEAATAKYGYVTIPVNETALMIAVASQGPISVAIDASADSFQNYESGVYYNPTCSTTDLDHAVTLIGYGTDATSGEAYWLAKNSWGTDWGMDGYIWMSRNRNNNCGIATNASFPYPS